MNEIITNKDKPLWFVKESADLMEYSEGDLANEIFSLVDARIIKEQKEILSAVIEKSPIIAELAKGLKKTQRLQLVFSDEIKEKLADGTYHIMKKKDAEGIFKAIVVDSKGTIRANADFKFEDVMEGVSTEKMISAMQGAAVQKQLREIAQQLEDMSATMEEVLVGQHNDRLAMYYSGEAIYREALATTKPDRKSQLSTAAIMELTNAVTSLQTTLAYEISSVCEKYDDDKGRFIGLKSDKLQEKMFVINSSFQTIHKAMTLKSAIYYQEEEYGALTTVLMEYKSFLERTLTDENSRILYLADPNEKSLAGTWNLRKNELPLRIEKTREILSKPEAFALEFDEEDV